MSSKVTPWQRKQLIEKQKCLLFSSNFRLFHKQIIFSG